MEYLPKHQDKKQCAWKFEDIFLHSLQDICNYNQRLYVSRVVGRDLLRTKLDTTLQEHWVLSLYGSTVLTGECRNWTTQDEKSTRHFHALFKELGWLGRKREVQGRYQMTARCHRTSRCLQHVAIYFAMSEDIALQASWCQIGVVSWQTVMPKFKGASRWTRWFQITTMSVTPVPDYATLGIGKHPPS